MEKSKELLKVNKVVPFLKLAIKKDGGGTVGTGPHKVKLLKDKVGKKREYHTGKEIYVMWYFVEENGEEKKYPVPVKDDNNEVHYLIQRLAEFSEGEEIIMEYKRKGAMGYIDVRSVKDSVVEKETLPPEVSDDEIPVIEEDEDYGEPPE